MLLIDESRIGIQGLVNCSAKVQLARCTTGIAVVLQCGHWLLTRP